MARAALAVAAILLRCGGVLGQAPMENVALGKPAEQSSTYGQAGSLAVAGLAVDGNSEPRFQHGRSCSHTKTDPGGTWWRVDLEAQYWVHSVSITNRADCCSERLRNLTVSVDAEKTTPGQGSTCAGHLAAVGKGATITLDCARTMAGRYVTIYIPTEKLTLCEVQVLAE